VLTKLGYLATGYKKFCSHDLQFVHLFFSSKPTVKTYIPVNKNNIGTGARPIQDIVAIESLKHTIMNMHINCCKILSGLCKNYS